MDNKPNYDNTGAAFKNPRKTTTKHPDLSGKATIGGKQFWVSAWYKVDKNNQQYIAFNFKEKDDAATYQKRTYQSEPSKDQTTTTNESPNTPTGMVDKKTGPDEDVPF